MNLQAKYMDGKTSKQHDAIVSFQPNRLVINYTTVEGGKEERSWEVKNIGKQEVRTSMNHLKYGDFPHEVLEFPSAKDIDLIIKQFPNAAFHQSTYNKFTGFGWKGIVGAMIGVVLVAFIFVLYVAPYVAESFAKMIPQEYEVVIGENYRDSFLEFSEIDSSKTEELQYFFDELNLQSDYDVNLYVLKGGMVNAFALPGGIIFVYEGILEEMETAEELAGLLAHELAHINERHSIRKISRDLSMYVLLASLTGDAGGFTSVLIDNSQSLASFSNSRDFEKDADITGMELLVEQKINPTGLLTLFDKFDKLHQSPVDTTERTETMDSLTQIEEESSFSKEVLVEVSELMSTHPSPKNRIEYLNELIEENDYHQLEIPQSLKDSWDRIKTTEVKGDELDPKND